MAPPFVVVLVRGREDQRRPLTETRVSIGRSPKNDLVVPDLSLSRNHAEIRRRDSRYVILDRGSRNGTFLNKERVKGEQVLKDGDVIRLGDTVLLYHDAVPSDVRVSEEGQELGAGSVAIPAQDLINSTFRSFRIGERRLLELLSRSTRMLIAEAGEEGLFEEVLDTALDAVSGERGALMLLEEQTRELRPRATRIRHGEADLVVSRTIARLALEEKTSVITTDARSDPRFDAAVSVSLQGVRSAMCAPLWHEGQVVGLLYLDRRYSEHAFGERELAVLTVLANLVAAKLLNLRLRQEAELKRALEEELRLASEIQRSLLPARDPEFEGWEFCGMSIPSRSVGGDLFDFIRKSDRILGLAVGDVAGKGISAALLLASLQANLRAFAMSAPDPAEVMRSLNLALVRQGIPNKFATVFYGELDLETGSLRYVSAGHTPSLLLQPDGRIERLRTGGMIVGAFEDLARYEVGETRLEPGALLVAYSDGITEARRDPESGDRDGLGEEAHDEMFGEERLERAVREALGAPVLAVREGILDALETFTGGSPPADDTTLLVARRLP